MRPLIALIISASTITAWAGQPFLSTDVKGSLWAINNNGQAVGYTTNPDGSLTAIIFDGAVNKIASGKNATDINDQGGILYVDRYQDSYYYDQSTGTSTLTRDRMYDGASHYNTKLNNNGLMIGYHHQYSQIRDTWAFTCTLSNTTPVILPNHQIYSDPGPITGSFAYGLNDTGIVVGSCGWWPGDANPYQLVAAYWTGTTIHKMDTLGYSYSRAWAIDNNGDIAGAFYDNNNIAHGFLYSSGTTHDLTNFTEEPVAINDLGVILGRKTFYEGGLVKSLQDFVPAGWTIDRAFDINNANQVCGDAIGPDGLTHGFILQVPEPATLSMLAAGMLLGLRRRRS